VKDPKGTFGVCRASFIDEKTGKKKILLLEIPELVTPLSRDSERILKESDNNHETSNGR